MNQASTQLARLMQAIEFDESDLAANKNDYMSKKQRKTLNQKRTFWRWVIIFDFLLIPIVLSLNIREGYRVGGTLSSRLGISGLIIFIAFLLFLDAFGRWKLLSHDLQKGFTLCIEGEVRLNLGRNRHIIGIKNISFNVVETYIPLGFTPGHTYRIFYAPFSQTILSAEWIGNFT